MGFMTTMTVMHDGKEYKAGTAIEVAGDEAQALIDAGAIEGSEDDGELSGLSVAQLNELALAEGVTGMPEKAKKVAIIAAITAHRAAASQ